MNFGLNTANWSLNTILPLFNNGRLVLYTGAPPATPETAQAGTALATFTFSATAFGTPTLSGGNDQATASFTATSVTPGASGTVGSARAVLNSSAWASGMTTTQLYQVVTSSNNYYVCVRSGTAGSTAPSTTTFNSPIIDGGVEWLYYSTTNTQNSVLADFTVNTSGADITIGSVVITTTVNVTIEYANDNEHMSFALVA